MWTDRGHLVTRCHSALLPNLYGIELFTIPPSMTTPPDGDAVVICGPKSAPVGADLMNHDPKLGMVRDGDRWWIIDKTTGRGLARRSATNPLGMEISATSPATATVLLRGGCRTQRFEGYCNRQ